MNAAVLSQVDNPGAAYMRSLRQDHAGLSRVLRLIDALSDRLVEQSEQVRPVLLDAFRYLLQYHHAYHHPREDRLFARIRARRPALAETLDRIGHEHETGEHEIARLFDDLSAAEPGRLAGKAGTRLAARISDYVRHSRIHMRDEEVVFYARAELVLNDADWLDIIDTDGPQDPLANALKLAEHYPSLAEHLKLRSLSGGLAAGVGEDQADLHRQLLDLTDLYGGLLHEGLDLTRSNVKRLAAVRTPGALVRALGDISTDNLRYAGQCVTRPSRWVINAGCGALIGWVKPHIPRPE